MSWETPSRVTVAGSSPHPAGAAPPAMGKCLKHQLRVNLGFFLGLSPVLKSFYNGHRASDSAAAASPGRISSSFSSG